MNFKHILTDMGHKTNEKQKSERRDTELVRYVRRWREEQQLTMRAAGEKIGISPTTLSDFVNGKQAATLEMVIFFADYFNLSIDEVAKMDGRAVTISASDEDRYRRLVRMLQHLPKSDRILEALETFDVHELDYLLTTIEVIEAQRRQGR